MSGPQIAVSDPQGCLDFWQHQNQNRMSFGLAKTPLTTANTSFLHHSSRTRTDIEPQLALRCHRDIAALHQVEYRSKGSCVRGRIISRRIRINESRRDGAATARHISQSQILLMDVGFHERNDPRCCRAGITLFECTNKAASLSVTFTFARS